MSIFSIEFTGEEMMMNNEKVANGKITIGNFSEEFNASLEYWSKESYVAQWHSAISRLLENNSPVGIVTNMYDPKWANFIIWWVFYPVYEKVYIQNKILFIDQLKKEFDESNLSSHIENRETITEEGEKISEWITTKMDLDAFVKKSIKSE